MQRDCCQKTGPQVWTSEYRHKKARFDEECRIALHVTPLMGFLLRFSQPHCPERSRTSDVFDKKKALKDVDAHVCVRVCIVGHIRYG